MYEIIVSIIASQFTSALWYSPLMVGVQWSCLVFPGCTKEEIQTLLSRKTPYAIAFVSSVFLTLILKWYFLQLVFYLFKIVAGLW